jgi:hypothetical protein
VNNFAATAIAVDRLGNVYVESEDVILKLAPVTDSR